jgi:hypothetical protein
MQLTYRIFGPTLALVLKVVYATRLVDFENIPQSLSTLSSDHDSQLTANDSKTEESCQSLALLLPAPNLHFRTTIGIYMRICRAANACPTGETIWRPKHPTCLGGHLDGKVHGCISSVWLGL